MSIKKQILKDKMAEICELCNSDLRDIKEYLKTKYNLPKNIDLSKDMKAFKLLIEENYKPNKRNLIEEFKDKFIGGNKNDY